MRKKRGTETGAETDSLCFWSSWKDGVGDPEGMEGRKCSQVPLWGEGQPMPRNCGWLGTQVATLGVSFRGSVVFSWLFTPYNYLFLFFLSHLALCVSVHRAEDGPPLDPESPCPLLQETDVDHWAFSDYSPPASQEEESDHLLVLRAYSWFKNLWSKGHSVQICLLDLCVYVCVDGWVLEFGE